MCIFIHSCGGGEGREGGMSVVCGCVWLEGKEGEGQSELKFDCGK